jgi:hypothetical protein
VKDLRAPLREPVGVREAATMTASWSYRRGLDECERLRMGGGRTILERIRGEADEGEDWKRAEEVRQRANMLLTYNNPEMK